MRLCRAGEDGSVDPENALILSKTNPFSGISDSGASGEGDDRLVLRRGDEAIFLVLPFGVPFVEFAAANATVAPWRAVNAGLCTFLRGCPVPSRLSRAKLSISAVMRPCDPIQL